MEPQIQYAKTSDGVDIAFATAGDGPPLLVVPNGVTNHVQAIWEALAYIYQPLAERFHLVWYDSRGTGLSDREATDFSMDAMVRDLEAVVEGAGLTGFAMSAISDAVPIAVTYAAMRPEAISSLVLADGWMNSSDWMSQNPANGAEAALRSGDWTVYTETLARVFVGFDNQELAAKTAAYIRECVEPEALRAAYSSQEDWDVSTLLPRLTTHTLVVHNRDNRFVPVQAGQRLAARIPDARFQLLDGREQLAGAITMFLDGGREAEATPTAQSKRVKETSGTAIILFADIADSTALTERLGDAAFRDKARDLDEALRRAITSNGGTAIDGKLLGDGVLATFGAAREAIACASAIHDAGSRTGLPIHVGIHAGDVIRESNNVYGGAVNIAARISDEAAAGETLVSATVRDLARTSSGVSFDDRGKRELKGVSEPVRMFAVRELLA